MRIATAAIVILGGSALMYWLHTLTPVSIAVYVALAAVCFWGTPRYMRHKMIKNIEKILRNAKNKQLCGPKTLTLRESEFELSGENEDTVYQYSAVQRTATDDKHYYILLMNSPRSSKCRSQRLKTMRKSRSSTTKSPQISRMKP